MNSHVRPGPGYAGLVFAFFLGGMTFWPVDAAVGFGVPAFFAHGVLAFWTARVGFATIPWWPLLGALPLGYFAGPWNALCFALTCYVPMVLYHLLPWLRCPAPGHSVRRLFKLLMTLAIFPAPTIMLLEVLLRLKALNADVSLALAIWGESVLALTLGVTLALSSPLTPRRRLELLLICVGMLMLWVLGCGFPSLWRVVPCQLLFFPALIIAAFRCDLAGAAAVGVMMVVLPALSPQMPGALGAGEERLYSDVAITLVLCISGQLVAVLAAGFRRNEAQLREFQHRFESLLEHSPSYLTVQDLSGRYQLVNRAFAQLAWRSPAEVVGLSADELFPREQLAEQLEHNRQVMERMEPMQFEEVLTLDRRTITVLSSRFPLFGADGAPVGVGCVSADITRIREEQLRRREAEGKYQALIEQSLMGIFIVQDEHYVYVNPRMAAMAGTTPEELIGKSIGTILAPQEHARLSAQIARRYRDNIEEMQYSTQIVGRNGALVDLEVHSRLFEYQGRRAIIGGVMDVTERLAADAELRLAAKVFENSTEGILVTDAEAHIIAVNSAFSRITGYSAEQTLGRLSRLFREGSPLNTAELREALEQDGYWQGELTDWRRDGESYPTELSISAVRDPNGALTNYVGVFTDITLRKQAEERLQFLANHDPLTRLSNRNSLIGRLESLLSQPQNGQRHALMFIDLDRFKLINDSFGHAAGDDLLREIAARLTQAAGERGLLSRLGGDEFTLLVEQYGDQLELEMLAEAILAELARPMFIHEHEVVVSGSIGISVSPGDGNDAMTLLKNADVAMYRAKDAGKNTHRFFAADMNSQTFERLRLENALRQALERREFELHYQPQVSAVSHTFEAVEALIRWRHPTLGLVPPLKFIPLAEETGLIRPIGVWILNEACRQLTAWDAAGIKVPRVAVNLSARQFSPALVQQVAEALHASGLEASRLELEITESLLMQNPLEAVDILHQLKSLGVHIAIDDFGTGYSSLSYLKRFPLDALKIDRSFVDGLPLDEDDAAIAEAIMAMAKKLRFTVVAEGVETLEQSQFLQTKGCALLQGYYFARPMPAGELAGWMKGRSVMTLSANEVMI
ncbi:EAL domain-containing protein [Crenobacter sp. SG2305]|uniref:sensor domain-containing protein n=1 Tax=Crenobacter oryzisoli TaxID=3056844 RepID=UPI0025AA94AF|nr:EAL domain-containing protein [Crenobacter sp. SG2305]MDN0083320.1 EAL domain-containing protein [Crenobacter sp. SG2305]